MTFDMFNNTFERAIKGAYLPYNNSISRVVSEMRMRKHNWPNNTAEFVNETKSTDNVELNPLIIIFCFNQKSKMAAIADR
jgi:hypothetical protein